MTSSHTTSAGHLKWPWMRAAIGLAQYFALFSWLLSLLVSLDQCWSTPLNLSLVKLCRVEGLLTHLLSVADNDRYAMIHARKPELKSEHT